MKQPIAGVAPVDVEEVEMMTVWPSHAAYAMGRFLGGLYEIGGRGVFTLGKLIVLLSIPGQLKLYFYKAIFGSRYRLTNRRVVIQGNLTGTDGPSVELDRFYSIDIEVRPGQAWYHAGDLVFRSGPTETFRLVGVSRPETFRQTCLKAHLSYVGVKEACEREAALV